MKKFMAISIFMFMALSTLSAKVALKVRRPVEKPFKVGLVTGLNHGIYLGLGDDRLHLTNVSFGISGGYQFSDRLYLNLAMIKDNQLAMGKGGQNTSALCQNTFFSSFLKMPGRCAALVYRADLWYSWRQFYLGGGLGSFHHGGFTFQENDLLNSHFKHVTISALVGFPIIRSAVTITPLARIEKSVFFSAAIDDDVNASAWLFSLEVYFHWSIF